MLLLLTVFAVWLGWELSFIRQRQAWLRENAPLVEGVPSPRPAPKAALFPWRHWLGNNEVPLIWDRGVWSDAERAGVVRLFPEANLEEPPKTNNYTWVLTPRTGALTVDPAVVVPPASSTTGARTPAP